MTLEERGVVFRGCADILLPIFAQFDQSFSRAKDLIWQHDLFADSMIAAGLTGTGMGTKLYVSNLDSGVTNEDIKVVKYLFVPLNAVFVCIWNSSFFGFEIFRNYFLRLESLSGLRFIMKGMGAQV